MSVASTGVSSSQTAYRQTSEARHDVRSPGNPASRATLVRPHPRLRLYTDKILINVSESYEPKYEEIEAAVISLGFDYGGTTVCCTDLSPQVYCGEEGGYQVLQRDREFEAHARYLVESLGAVELGCLDDYATVPGSEAAYMVRVDGNVHAICTFGAYALPQLKQLGWKISIDDNYKWKVVDSQTAWYADVEADSEENSESDWFSLELGVTLEGNKVNLLPVLLEYLEQTRASTIEGLMRSYQRCVALPIGDGRYLTIPTERFKLVMQVLTEMYREGSSSKEKMPFPEVQAAALGQLGLAFEGEEGAKLVWGGDTGLQDRGISLSKGHEQTIAPSPEGLQATLRPYQRIGLSFLQHLRINRVGGILADDMGLGKTLQTIAHFLSEKIAGRMNKPSMVIAPTSLVGNWEREIAKFAPQLKTLVLHGPKRHKRFSEIDDADIIITTYPCITRDVEEMVDREFYLLVLDEAHTIKNSTGLGHRTMKKLNCEYPLCITGTPVENNLQELWALFDFVMPAMLGDARSFRTKYRLPIEKEGKTAKLMQLREIVQPFILRRLKTEVAKELPPKTEIVRPVELVDSQRDFYESIRISAHARVRKVIRTKGLAGSTIAILDALMKLRQVCCDPRLVNVVGANQVKESAKFELLFDLVPSLLGQGRRILIFSQFTSMLDLMAEELKDREIGYQMLTGSTKDRQAEIDAFEGGNADVFLLSLKAAGTGLNLTSADTVIHYDPWWNPQAQAQATDRAYRIGQKNPVFVYNLIVAGRVEEQMLALQKRKRFLADSI
ncbi:MAG: DEAD/DEAH box helicase [Kofleriaceae bacterium]|nr:DEAD/DEAH box helicase [Kofleriaceae bacterium]